MPLSALDIAICNKFKNVNYYTSSRSLREIIFLPTACKC
jgi:hypothetical protein